MDNMLKDLRQELDRRTESGASTDQPDLVVVVREICDLEPSSMAQLGMLAAAGPTHHMRVVVASERPVTELMRACPFLDDFGTRIVLRTRDEEESIVLLGAPRAEELGRGGHALLRLEGRTPIQGWACRVPPDHVARLLSLMGTRAAHVVVEPEEPGAVPDSADAVADDDPSEMALAEPPNREVNSVPPDLAVPAGEPLRRSQHAVTSPLLRKLRSAPIRVRCFGARDVWCGDHLLELREAELLLLLAAHPVRGIQSEALADMLWEAELSDSERALRVRRSRLRKELRSLFPSLLGDPLPGDAAHGERVVVINPEVISSDVHEFLEILQCARKLETPAAIQAYEEALGLYRGDLLDSLDVPNFRWMYDGAQIALTLRSDYRRQHRDARVHLAELLAAGPETGLARAEELYSGLCAEDPDDERLWMALFQVHEHAGSALGLESAVRKLRFALAELAPGEPDPETIPLPAKLDSLVNQIRDRISGRTVRTS